MSLNNADLQGASRDAFAALLDTFGYAQLADLRIAQLAALIAEALEVINPEEFDMGIDAADLSMGFRAIVDQCEGGES